MTSDKVLFDAANPGVPSSSGDEFAFAAIALLFVVFGLMVMFRPKLGRSVDLTANRGMGLVVALFGAANLVAFAAPYVIALRAQVELRSGKAEVVEGCVERYTTERYSKSVDTYFSVQGTPFHFSSVSFVPGYHGASDEIHPGQRVKITKHDDFVIRVEMSPGSCTAPAI